MIIITYIGLYCHYPCHIFYYKFRFLGGQDLAMNSYKCTARSQYNAQHHTGKTDQVFNRQTNNSIDRWTNTLPR